MATPRGAAALLRSVRQAVFPQFRCVATSSVESSFYDSTVEKYAQQEIEVLSLKEMLNFGKDAWNDPAKILKSARYVHKEIPKRLARRLLDLQLLPHIVVINPHIRKVYDNYRRSFESLRRLPPVTSLEENTAFCAALRQELDLHATLLDALATGLRECKSKEVVGASLQLDDFFDSMLRSRISRRVIVEQHLHISTRRPGYVGNICTDLVVYDAVDFAAEKARQVCTETYGLAPEVRVKGDLSATLPYIPGHIDYMLYELLKNAMRAVVENHLSHPKASYTTLLPAVRVHICAGTKELTFRISDEGGGIPLDRVDKVFSYGYTTIGMSPEDRRGAGVASITPPASTNGPSASGAGLDALVPTAAVGPDRYKMAGLGFGLPMSRLFARYFGGDLKLQVIPSYGTDAYLTLRRLKESDWQTDLPDPDGPTRSKFVPTATFQPQPRR